MQQMSADLLRMLSLQPMAAVSDQMLLEVWYPCGHLLQGMRFERADWILVTQQEKCRLLDLALGQRFGARPVAFEVTVPVQRTAKAASSSVST